MRKINSFNNTYNIIGPNIKKIRKMNHITQEDLCSRMQVLGYQISRSDISKIETGGKMITDFEIVGFMKALKVTILDLFQGII